MLDYLTSRLSDVQVQRCTRIIYPTLSYDEALSASGLPTLSKRREEVSLKLFTEISTNKEHKLHSFLPDENISTYSLTTKDYINY